MAVKKINFGAAFAELEGIVEELETREIDLDTDLPKFERGMKLAKLLKEKISEAENKVEEIDLTYKE